jgi:hypothetical protein
VERGAIPPLWFFCYLFLGIVSFFNESTPLRVEVSKTNAAD